MKNITVSKPKTLKGLIEMIDFYGKKIKNPKTKPEVKTLLTGRVEGAIEMLSLAGIITDAHETIAKQYFDNNYRVVE